MKVFIASILLLSVLVSSHRVIPEYEINLDLPLEQRYELLVQDLLEPAQEAMNHIFDKVLKVLSPALKALAQLRGPETPELWEELQFFAKKINRPVEDIQIVNWLYELDTIMIPHEIREQLDFMGETLDIFGHPWCTGILAYDKDGKVNHARNLDFSMPEYLSKILYIGKFTRKGKEIFRAQMIVGFAGVITGFKSGVISVEVNTRFSQVLGQNIDTIFNLILRRNPLALWEIRKTLENTQSFEDGVHQLSTKKFTSPLYLTMAGVRQGTIVAREPNGVAHKIVLGVDHPKYIVITNFDYWNNDWREYFDPTANFYRRRIGVQKALDGLDVIDQEILFNTINREDVIAKDTIYQGIMNVETGFFQATCPYVSKK